MKSREYKLYLRKLKIEKILIYSVQILIIVGFNILWEYASNKGIINTFIYSSPSRMIKTIIDLYNQNNLFNHIWVTVYETVISFSLATILGTIIAIILWYSKFLYRVFDPYLTVFNSLPKVALGPIIIIIFGANIKSIIIMALLISIVITISNVYSGFINTDKNKIKLLKSFGASKNQMLKYLIIPNPEKVKLLNKMITLYLGGSSFLQISNIVGMDESMVEKRILSRTNLGIIPYKGEEFEGQHEPVVSEEIYNRIIKMNKLRSKSRTARHYLLSGKIYCGKCGAKYRYQKWGKRLICYCYSQQKSRPKFIKNPNCKNKRYDSFEIEDAVLENIFAMSLDEKMFEENMLTLNVNTVEELENRINKLSNQIENLLNYISLGIAIKETSNKINVLEEERKKLKEQLKDEREAQSQIETTKSMIKNLREVWNYMAFNEQRLIIEHLVEKIVIDDNKINIYYQLK